MKKTFNVRINSYPILKKLIMKTKITFLIIVVSISNLLATDTYSQVAKVSLNLENPSLEQIMNEIEEQTEFYFIFNQKQVDVDRIIDINAENYLIADLLPKLFDGTDVLYKVLDRNILLTINTSENTSKDPVLKQELQQKQITGTVTEKNGSPMPGVNVVVKGTTQGTMTDINGKYSLDVPQGAISLTFSFIGMEPQEIAIGTLSQIDVVMKELAIGLDEVVVIGYGEVKKTTLTGSVSTLNTEKISEIPVTDISHAIGGRMAGVTIQTGTGGQPGYDDPVIYIRGVVTTGNNAPLVIVDGIKRDNLRQIDPNLIESISILKDAAAVAPYGIGGANGVILITTKQGKESKATFRLISSSSFENPTYLPSMLSVTDYMRLQNEAYFNQTPNGQAQPFSDDRITNYQTYHNEDPYRYPESSKFTDVFRKNLLVQKYNLELSGGNEFMNYNSQLGYLDQEGLYGPIGYKRYNYSINLVTRPTNTTKVGVSVIGSVEKTRQTAGNQNNMILHMFYEFVPTEALLYPDGEHWGASNAKNPVAQLRSDGYEVLDRNTTLGSIFIEQQLPFIKGLNIKGVFSYDPTQSILKNWNLPLVYHVIDYTTTPYTFTEAFLGANRTRLNLSHTKSTNYTIQGFINYKRDFGDHSVTGLLVAEGRKNQKNLFSATRNQFDVLIDEMSMGSSDKNEFDNSGSSSSASELGYVYRFTYNYKEKYILETAGRYDGHYYFAPGERWGFFPSYSLAWRMSEENFMKKFSNLNNLKLRGSWGKSGMLAGSPFQYLAGYTLRSTAYAFGSDRLVQASSVATEPNPNITWEISTKTNLGFDLTMWNSLLKVEFNYFQEKRTGMLLPPQVTVPVEYGISLSQENKGMMKNKGVEVTLGSQKRLNNGMEINLDFNFSYAKNEMIEVFESDAERLNPNRTLRGRAYGTPFGYQSDGLFSTADDLNGDGIINSEDGYDIVQFGTLHPGDIRYKDLNGDKKLDVNDYAPIGYPSYPFMTYGLSSSISWKGFDLSILLQGAALVSRDINQYLVVPFMVNASNTSYEYYNNRWTPDNQDAKYPRATPSPTTNSTQPSDYWMLNTNYLRFKTFIFGYSIPEHLTDKLKINNIRISLVGNNWLTLSNLTYLDPEMGSYNEESYPLMKSTALGIDITF